MGFYINIYASWASGALDPERDAAGDVVTSVKRFGLLNLISVHFALFGIFLYVQYAEC